VAHEIDDGGGMETATAELLRRAAGDCDFTVVAWRLAPDLRPLVRWRRVPVPARPFAVRFVLFWLLAGARLLAVPRDLTHAVGAIVPNRVDVASIHFCHAAAPMDARADSEGLARRVHTRTLRWLALHAERWCFRPSRLRRFGVVSPGVGREIEDYYPGIPVVLTPNGVDTERFRPDAATRAAIRREQGVGADDVVAAFVGGDWARKGLALAIGSLGSAARGGSPVQLWVVGRGDVAGYRAIANAAGVADRVSFLGFRRDRERVLQAADIFVLPSRYETFCIAAFEAAATALPLVITPVNDVRALVRDGTGGLIVAADAGAVGDALAVLASDRARREADGRAARARALGFTWAASVESVTHLYRDLLAAT
jgi:glycosyltransferase involved in cell wall biosynthesis